MSSILRPTLTNSQLEELIEGLRYKVDISLFNDSRYTPEQMHEIRLGLIAGVDIKKYASFDCDAFTMRSIRENLVKCVV